MFLVEGTIGAGKTTFLKILQKGCPAFKTVLEPVTQWHHEDEGVPSSQSILECFIQDPYRWACTMETFAMLCRWQDHRHLMSTAGDSPVICERSVYSGHYCFARNGFIQGFMTEVEWRVYMQFYHRLVREQCEPPRGFIYLRTDPNIAYARIQQRNRLGEEGITRQYLEQLHERHEEFLIQRCVDDERLKEVPVLVLDGNPSYLHEPDYAQYLVDQVSDFIQTHALLIHATPSDISSSCGLYE